MGTESIVKRFANEAIGNLGVISEYLVGQYEASRHVGLQTAQDVETEANIYVATLWATLLHNKFPDLNLDTEEIGARIDAGGRFTVRVDSIDGSKHYRAGIPIFGSNVSLHLDGKTVFGACVYPLANHENYYAVVGEGAYRNGSKIEVSAVNYLQNGFVALEAPTSKLAQTDPDSFQSAICMQNALEKVSFRLRNFGLGGLGICLVASGACVAYVDLSGTTKIYNVDAALMILKEAGGEVSEVDMKGNHILVASNGYVHQELLDLCKIL